MTKSALFRSSCKNDLKRANASEFRGGGVLYLGGPDIQIGDNGSQFRGVGVLFLGGEVYLLLLILHF